MEKLEHVKGTFKNNVLFLTVFDLKSAFSEKLRELFCLKIIIITCFQGLHSLGD